MGVVYRARHLIWNEEKALKVLLAPVPGEQQGLKRLMAEALVMRQLQHPHIVRVEDADYTEDDQLFVVMEYVDGQSLRQKLDRGGPLAPELALQIAAQTCSALSAAHQKGIIHRDIKPQNLLLAKSADGGESVRVIDFGIAKVREEAGLGFTGMVTSTTGLFVGTPRYASPEQALGMRGSDLDGRTDLYSLGLVLYEMLTGRLPFAADTPVAVLLQRLQVPPIPLDLACPGLSCPPDVSRLVTRALEKERENRYRSAEEMERAIMVVLQTWRAERERQEPERAAAARLAADAERERQERETVALVSQVLRESVGQPSGAETVIEPPTTLGTVPPVQPRPVLWARPRKLMAAGGVMIVVLLAAWLIFRPKPHVAPPSAAVVAPPSIAAPSEVGSALPPLATTTISAGTVITVRSVDTIDPKNSAVGQEFRAAVAAPVLVGGSEAIHRDDGALLRLLETASTGDPSGKTDMILELVAVTTGGQTYQISSTPYLIKGGFLRKKLVALGTQIQFTLRAPVSVALQP